MNQEISKLEQQLAETKKQIESLEQQLAEVKKPKPWEPQGGIFTISSDGQVYSCYTLEVYRQFGAERMTAQLAQKAAEAMRIHNRLLAYVHEFAPDYEPDWNNPREYKYFVYFDKIRNKWQMTYNEIFNSLGAVYMPEQVAHDLVAKLTSGEVVL